MRGAGSAEMITSKETTGKHTAKILETDVLLHSVDEASSPSLKAQQNTLANRSSSLRGVAPGKVNPRLQTKCPCIIFGKSYPSWIAFVSQLGYVLVMVILWDDKYLPLVEALVPEECAVWCMPDWAPLIAKIPHFAGSVESLTQ